MSERRGELRGAREERLFVKVLSLNDTAEKKSLIISGATEDVSASGLSLLVSKSIPAQTGLELWVEIKGCPGKFLLTGRVRWCRPRADEFNYGIELIDEGISDFADWQDLFV